MNPLFQAMGGMMPGPFGNIQQLKQQFQQFRQSTQGDPQQMVQQMLQSGRINQAQLNQAQMMAKQLGSFLQ